MSDRHVNQRLPTSTCVKYTYGLCAVGAQRVGNLPVAGIIGLGLEERVELCQAEMQ